MTIRAATLRFARHACLISLGLVFLASPLLADRQRSVEEEILAGLAETIQRTAEKATPSTVLIKIAVGGQEGYGSGAIVSADGLIVTCAHVAEPGQELVVVTSDGKEHVARKLGMNSTNDYAVLDIDAENLTPFPLGDSDRVRVRDWVIALGHPGGPYEDLQPAVAVGRVRGLHKKLPVQMNQKFYDDAIQTDCPIFGGNSGGPLVNLAGELVGINGAILLAGDKAYAVPVNEILADLDALKAGKSVEGRAAGNMMDVMKELQEDFDPEDMEKMFGDSPFGKFLAPFMGGGGTPSDRGAKLGAEVEETSGGLVLGSLEAGGTAEMSGLVEGDRITHIAGMEVADRDSLAKVLGYFRRGESTLFEVVRDGVATPVVVTFGFDGKARDVLLRRGFYALGVEAARSTVAVRVGGNQVGYGVVIDGAGWILTSDRLLGDGGNVTVSLYAGDELQASVVGREGKLDIALLKVEPGERKLAEAVVGDSRALDPGEWVVSGGDFRGPLAVGAVSAVDREIGEERKSPSLGLFDMFGGSNETPLRPYPAVVQHDSNLEEGLFGTPLFDADGRLVGVNVAKFYRGSSYAVPIHKVIEVLDRLKEGLVVEAPPTYQPSRGIEDMLRQFFGGGGDPGTAPAPDPDSPFLGIQADQRATDERGLVVAGAVPDTAAAEAGLQAGDVLTSFDGNETKDFESLRSAIFEHAVGDEVHLTFLRHEDGSWKEHEATVKLGRRGEGR